MKNRTPWQSYKPPASRDIRLLVPTTPRKEQIERERQKRAAVLLASREPRHRELGQELFDAMPFTPTTMNCDPYNVQRFQIWAVSRTLKVIRGFPKSYFITAIDSTEAYGANDLSALHWTTLHARIRRRITRSMGGNVAVVGIGELKWDDSRKLFIPHYHLIVANARRAQIEKMRRFYPDNRALKVQRLEDPARQIAYAFKLVVYRRPFEQTSSTRARAFRLRPPEERAFLEYLCSCRYPEFTFCINARLDGR